MSRGSQSKRPRAKAQAGAAGGGRRWGKRLLLLAALAALAAILSVGAVLLLYGSDPDLPRLDRVADYHPKVVTKVFAQGGELIGELFEERRTVVSRQEIPPVMIHALVDAEDAGFYQHGGLSYVGMLRALVHNLEPGAHIQGASTITQQLVRNLILKSRARTLKRKVQELILARRIETRLSKDEILWLYLNQFEFPYQRFGVEEASLFYFGKGIAEVDAGEAAVLASLPKGPNIDPWKHPERAKERQRYVLSQMVRYKHLDQAEAARFAAAPIKLVRRPAPYLGIAPEYVDQVRKILIERYGATELPLRGLRVRTACDAKVQKVAREAVDKGLIDLDGRQGYRKAIKHLKTPAAIALHRARLAKQHPKGPSRGRIVDGVVTEIVVGSEPEAAPRQPGATRSRSKGGGVKVHLGATLGWLPLGSGDRYNPKGLPPDKRFAVGDVLRVRVIDAPKDQPPVLALELGPQAAAVVIDPSTREVKALVGGYQYRSGNFDHAIAAKRQPGSSFKPFVYAAAFATARFTPASVLIDGPQTYAAPGLAPWKPQNAEKEEFLGPVRLRVALARSLNTIASQLVDIDRDGVDPNAVVALAHEAGIESALQPNPSLALGSSEVSALELTNAYATFAAGGRRRSPRFVLSVDGEGAEGREDQRARLVPQHEPGPEEVEAMKPELAFLVTSMMTSVIQEGTAASARSQLKRPAAGKTGTTNAHRDAWFVGYTPDLVTGVWVGFDDMRQLGRGEQGARSALPIWIAIMNGALKGVPPRPFAQPPGVVVQRIDPQTGLLASPGAPNGIDEVFLEGTAPTEVAPAAGEVNPDTYIIDQAQ